jgi:hypothetical protein
MANGSVLSGWGKVITAMIAIGLAVGLAVGGLGIVGMIPSGAVPALIGVICGLSAPLLILRMRPNH